MNTMPTSCEYFSFFLWQMAKRLDAELISLSVTAPTVPYEVVYTDRTVMVSNPTDFPDAHEDTGKLCEIKEPMVTSRIIVPQGAYSPC
jgi:translation elongation factor EF-4